MNASLSPKPDSTIPTLASVSEVTEPSEHSQTAEAVGDVVFGSVAGAIGKVFEYPFDTVKVRLQSQGKSVYKNSLDCFQQAIRSDGVVRGLYRGLSAPVFGAAVETSSLFFSYRLSQDILIETLYARNHNDKDELPMDALFLAGAMSGAFTSLWLTPIELVKCQMQVSLAPGSIRGPGVLSVIRDVFRYNGPLGFWHGQLGTLIREAGGSAAWFGAYESVKKFFQDQNTRRSALESSPPSSNTLANGHEQQLHLPQLLAAGASAGIAYNFAFFPADTIKSRMQTVKVGNGMIAESTISKPSGPIAAVLASSSGGFVASSTTSNRVRAPNFWDTGKTIWREAGVRGLYRGCGITLARSALSSPIIFGIYETLKGWQKS